MVIGIVFGTQKGNYEKVYTKEQLKKAVEEVRSGAMTAYSDNAHDVTATPATTLDGSGSCLL